MKNIRIFLALSILASFTSQAQQVINGKADISCFNFQLQESIELSGAWEFYWDQLLVPDDFTITRKPSYINVPGSWHRQNFPLTGVGTYRAVFSTDPSQNGIVLYFPIINSSAKIWVNKKLMTETGIVSRDLNTYKPRLSGTLITLPDNVHQVEVIVQAANFNYTSAGIVYSPEMGKASVIFSNIDKTNGVENFFAGSLIAMFFYQIILYFLYQHGKPHLWLALICLGVASRAMIVHGGSFLLPNIFPSVDWEIWKKIEFGSVYAIIALFPLYVYHLFIEHAPRKPILFFVGLAAVLFSFVLTTHQPVYGQLLEVSHVGLLLAFVYAVYSIGKAWRLGNNDAKIILFGVLASFPFILIEILKNSVLIRMNVDFMYLVELGVLVFLLFQVYLLANHYAKAYKNLEIMNINLEKVVEERTSQLVTANTVKDRLLSVISHDVKSPLNSLRGILQIYNMGAINQDEFTKLTRQVEDDLNKTSLLLENILYWTASQLKGIDVKIEKFDVHQVVEENIHLFKSIAESKKLLLSYNVPLKLEIESDRNILNLVVRNLIANAIKFSFDGGMVDVRVSATKQLFALHVVDSGTGMSREVIENLLGSESTKSSSGTNNETGTGLGLILCRNYLQKAGGQLTVESTLGKGSTFTIELPLR